jgi:hypothetical protein
MHWDRRMNDLNLRNGTHHSVRAYLHEGGHLRLGFRGKEEERQVQFGTVALIQLQFSHFWGL